MPINNPAPPPTVTRLGDTAGATSWVLEDSDGTPIYRIDSTGFRYTKKGTKRI